MKPDKAIQPALRPRDAATLIILRRDSKDGEPRVLMGKRHEAHKFMPNKFVFPGGRVDVADCRVQPEKSLDPLVAHRLLTKMRGKPSPGRAQGLAMAAVRETFEECGLIIGRRTGSTRHTRSAAWQAFFDTGHSPSLDGLRLFARAITPPGRPRRFDTRFFVVEADHVSNIDTPYKVPTQELLDPYWLTISETRELDLPWITGEILRRLDKALAEPNALTADTPCTFQRMVGKDWHYEQI